MPHARAAAAFEPSGNTCRPKIVFCKSTATRMASKRAIHTPGATMSQRCLGNVTASSLTQVGGTFTVCSPAAHLAAPRAIPSIPRVAMKGTTRREVIANPLTKPTRPPTTIPPSSATLGGQECLSARAVTTLVKAMFDPTERSIPPLMMIRVMPIAPSATIMVCESTMRRFEMERDFSGDPVNSRKIRASHKDCFTASSQLVDLFVDLFLAADVNSASRLVEQQDVGVLVQEARQQNLLLVAS